jgi:site-specific DNA-methyltransferase (adenine-specific)
MKDMQFDVIVGNPPYQIGMGAEDGKRTANITPLYQMFVERAMELEPKYVAMITPSRWFTGGKGLEDYRTRMIADRRLAKIVDNPKLFDCFPGVEIKGGVSYFLWDRDHDGDCEFSTRVDGVIASTTTRDLRKGSGVILRDNNASEILTKVGRQTDESLETVVRHRDPFGQTLTSNFAGSKAKEFKGSIPLVYGSHVGHIRADQIERNADWVKKWKVLIPKAGDGHGRDVSYVLGEPIALAPGSACTCTYIVAGVFDAKAQAKNFANYLTTKFVRFLVLQRKATQDVRPEVFRFVPMLDMSRAWTDEDLYEHFGLTKKERAYIEESIHPRDVNLSLDSPIPASHLPGGAKYREPGKDRELAEVAGSDGEVDE